MVAQCDLVADLRQLAQLGNYESSDRLKWAFGEFDRGLILKVVPVQQTVNGDFTQGAGPVGGCVLVVLILDVTNELLNEIFHCDQSSRSTVFILDHR